MITLLTCLLIKNNLKMHYDAVNEHPQFMASKKPPSTEPILLAGVIDFLTVIVLCNAITDIASIVYNIASIIYSITLALP